MIENILMLLSVPTQIVPTFVAPGNVFDFIQLMKVL